MHKTRSLLGSHQVITEFILSTTESLDSCETCSEISVSIFKEISLNEGNSAISKDVYRTKKN